MLIIIFYKSIEMNSHVLSYYFKKLTLFTLILQCDDIWKYTDIY